VFSSIFRRKKGFKIINLFSFFVCEDGKQLLYHKYQAFFPVLCGKCSEDAEDANVRELCGSAPPHPVRCPECMYCIVVV